MSKKTKKITAPVDELTTLRSRQPGEESELPVPRNREAPCEFTLGELLTTSAALLDGFQITDVNVSPEFEQPWGSIHIIGHTRLYISVHRDREAGLWFKAYMAGTDKTRPHIGWLTLPEARKFLQYWMAHPDWQRDEGADVYCWETGTPRTSPASDMSATPTHGRCKPPQEPCRPTSSPASRAWPVSWACERERGKDNG